MHAFGRAGVDGRRVGHVPPRSRPPATARRPPARPLTLGPRPPQVAAAQRDVSAKASTVRGGLAAARAPPRNLAAPPRQPPPLSRSPRRFFLPPPPSPLEQLIDQIVAVDATTGEFAAIQKEVRAMAEQAGTAALTRGIHNQGLKKVLMELYSKDPDQQEFLQVGGSGGRGSGSRGNPAGGEHLRAV